MVCRLKAQATIDAYQVSSYLEGHGLGKVVRRDNDSGGYRVLECSVRQPRRCCDQAVKRRKCP